MGIASWWYGPASIDRVPHSDLVPESQVLFGGQTLLLSHYQEIYDDFVAGCDEVRLYRNRPDADEFPRDSNSHSALVPDPNEADPAVMEALTLVGYVDHVNWPVIRFTFGSNRPGALSWDPNRVVGPNSDLRYELSRSALSEQRALTPEFEDMANERGEEAARRLSIAYQAAKRRVLESGQRRSTPWRRWSLLVSTGIWSLAAGLLLWLILGSEVPMPALLIAAIALSTSAHMVEVRVRSQLHQRHRNTWDRGPVRLRWTSRAAVRDARVNSRRDLWVGSVTGLVGAVIGAALAWFVPWLAARY